MAEVLGTGTGPEGPLGAPDADDLGTPGAPPMGAPSAGPPRRRHHHHVHTRTLVVGALILLALGALVGALVAPPVTLTPTPTPITAPKPSSSQSPGAPANSAALAAAVAPALVDINVTDSYEAVEGAGTGMVLTSSGIVVTNNHVVEGETSLSVRDVGNGKTYQATVLGYDRSADVAVLRLTGASALKAITVGASSRVAVGDGVVAVGNAGGAGGTPSHAGGKVTALNQSIVAQDQATGSSEQLNGLFETNAAVVPGDSGGALVNTSARVVGMVCAASEEYQFGSNATQGYAIPIATVHSVASEIVAGQRSIAVHVGATAFLGVQVATTFAAPEGATIFSVVRGGPADLAGLSAGDTITAIGGTTVTSPQSLTDAVLALQPGTTVQVQYVNPYGQSSTVGVTLKSGPPQ